MKLPMSSWRNISSKSSLVQTRPGSLTLDSRSKPWSRSLRVRRSSVCWLFLLDLSGINRFSVEYKSSHVRMFFILLLLGNVAIVVALPGVHNDTGPSFDCTHDFDEHISCCFEAQNCSGYNVTLEDREEVFRVTHCTPTQRDSGQCCCSIKMPFVWEEEHQGTVWKGGQRVQSRIINLTMSIKPKTPTIVSVNEVNRNFEVRWKTNINDFSTFTPYVMYRKKGGNEKEEYKFVQVAGIGALKVYTINEPDLESVTTYVVRVKTRSNYSGRFSDSSEELEFTTPASPYGLVLVLIISLSIASVLISSVIFGSYVKLKTQWWDTISKGPNPKLLDMRPCVQQFLKPESTIISSTCVEPLITDDSKPWLKGSVTDTSSGSFQQSSGISSGSSCLSYANTEPADIIAGVHDALGKAFPNISPVSPMTTNLATDSNKDCCLFPAPDVSSHVIADDVNSGSSGFDNKTYAIVIPSSPPEIILDKSEAQTQATMVCISAYHPSEDNTMACPDQQVPAGLLLNLATEASILMPSDMSYQPCSADAGLLSYAEESSENSICSGTTTTTICDAVSDVETECASFNDWVSDPTKTNGKSGEVTVCDDNPCYGHLPAGSWSLPPVVDDYQAFQSLVGQPDVSFSEEKSDEKEEHLDKYPVGSFTSIPPVPTGCINTMEGDQTFSELQRPFWSLMASDQPMRVITDSGYQCV